MKNKSFSLWSSAHWWVRFYSYLTIISIIYGILAAHIPAIIGNPWSSCDAGGLWCIVTFHWFGVPMALFSAFLAFYGLYYFSPRKITPYLLILIFSVAVNLVFFTFECVLLLDSINRSAPPWEILALYSISGLLIFGVFLGVFIAMKLLHYIRYKPKPFQNGTSLGADGYYHPVTEADIISLVKTARKFGLQVRCRGAAHSVGQAIYTDPGSGYDAVPNKVSENIPPEGENINIMLDQFKQIDWSKKAENIIEVEAGINLGADPGKSILEDGLLWKLWEENFALSDLGGITHQTISGFLMTGSAGGSLKYDILENLLAFRIVDGLGHAEWIDKDNPSFNAIGTSLGLMGIVTKVRLKLIPKYFIQGQEKTTPTDLDKCQIDLFGQGQGSKPSLENFLKNTPYSRIMWWPQEGVERIVTWSASRTLAPVPKKDIVPYYEFEKSKFYTILIQLIAAIFYTLLGNKNPFRVLGYTLLYHNRFQSLIQALWRPKLGVFFASLFSFLITFFLANILIPLFVIPLSIFRCITKCLLKTIIKQIQPLTSAKNPKKEFKDYYYNSLPMDNDVDDVFLGTEFTEIWIPIQHTTNVMNLLKDHYKKGKYKATGAFSNEIYAGNKSPFWMHPGYTDGNDAYKDGTIRIDLFWYTANDSTPNNKKEYYDQFWKLFKEAGVPFRLHWGKFIPDYDFKYWAAYYQENLPQYDAFLNLREQRDPDNIFLSNYWKLRLYGTLS